MAGQHLQRLTPKQQALRDLELARHELARETGLVAEEWSPRAVLTRSFERYRMLWIAGGVVAGLATIKLLMPSGSSRDDDNFDDDEIERPPPPRGLGRGLLGLMAGPLINMGRKAVTNYGMQFVQSWLQEQAGKTGDDSQPPIR
jgi:hypothetical protein